MSDQQTPVDYQAKALEIEKALGIYKVHPLIFKDEETGEDIIGYLKEPDRIVKLRVLDKSMMSPVTAAAELMEIILIKEYSDPRFSSERPQDDRIYLGATMAAFDLIKYSVNTFKKK